MTTLSPHVTGSALADLHSYLRILAGEHADGLLEVRYSRPNGGMRRLFRDSAETEDLARLILALGARTDVYTGVALRARRHGGRQAIPRSHLVYIEIDHPDALKRLEGYHAPATMLIASGTPGHLHAYWRLHTPAPAATVEQANLTLAHHLDGDQASIDIARILRPPGTRNHKHTPPGSVCLLHLNLTRGYTVAQLTNGLPRAPARGRPSPGRRVARRHPLDQTLLAISAEKYARALTGREPNRAGKLACPFHEDHTPSLQLYGDGSWYCYGCRAGGSIYDFAARLWDYPTKGPQFVELRQRLAQELNVTAVRVSDPLPGPRLERRWDERST